MKKYLFFLGHPAHFHLFKNIIKHLELKGHKAVIAIKTKDVLEKLLQDANVPYHNLLKKRRGNGFLQVSISELKKQTALYAICRKEKPDILIGTSHSIAIVGKLIGVPSFNVNEDDAHVIPQFARISYPLSTEIITPTVCNNGRWENKSIKYDGYHELAYLHPNYFKPNKEAVKNYFSPDLPYFLLRFSALDAHHDKGIRGLNFNLTKRIIGRIKKHGNVYITSERQLEPELEKYRIQIDPIDMHHIIAFAQLFVGDSQTMAAEAGVLGTPFIRYNDFVGRIGYLNDMENKYGLGYGVRTENPEQLFNILNDLLIMPDFKDGFIEKKNKMLKNKIDVSAFFVWFIENYPKSKQILKENPEYQLKFITQAK